MGGKLFCGDIVRRLRQQKGMTQAAFARLLGLSPSYLNQIENGQRPVTGTVQARVREVLGEDISAFSDEESQLASELREMLVDSEGRIGDISLAEVRGAVAASPRLVKHVLRVLRSAQRIRSDFSSLAEDVAGTERIRALEGAHFPYEEVRDFFYYRNNHIESLDKSAEKLASQCGFRVGEMHVDLEGYLKDRFGISIAIQPMGEGGDVLRRFDPASRTLWLSELLSPSRRAFHMAYQIALAAFGDLIDREVAGAGLSGADARSVCRVGLANYAAGALIMPYERFLGDAETLRYDIERLAVRYNSSFEQACHRLSTLQRPGRKGVPFYFVRVDMAGNISKRQSATSFHFARLGGVCPLWNVHEAFASPGKTLTQLARMPDGKTYLCVARTVSEAGGGYLKARRRFAVGLGCEVEHASKLIYSTGLDLTDPEAVVPIGVSCRVCERRDCPQRAFPPLSSRLVVDENARRLFPYDFDPAGLEKTG